MATKTAHYQLNQWEPGDDFLRSDFNEDNAKIDAAIKEKPEFVFGSYQGDNQTRRHIELGFRPKAVFIVGPTGEFADGGKEGGLLLDGHANTIGSYTHAEIEDGGFAVYYHYNINSSTINKTGTMHYYMAMR